MGRWLVATVAAPDLAAFKRAAASGGLIVGDRTVWAIKADGTWIPADAIDRNSRWGLVGWRDGFVDWGQEGATRTSADGLGWQGARSGPIEANLSTMVPFGDRLLLVGEAVRTRVGAWLSTDGSTWTDAGNAPVELWAAANWPAHGIVAAGGSGPSSTMWSSADGATWLAATEPTAIAGNPTVAGLAANRAEIVAIGNVDGRAAVWRSADLLTWSEVGVDWGRDATLQSLVDLNGILVIAGKRLARPTVWVSSDGLTWSAFDLPMADRIDGEATKAALLNGGLVVFGYATTDGGNGGAARVADLVWTLTRP